MTRNVRRRRLTVEKLAVNCLDVRELQRIGIFDHECATLCAWLRWPAIVQMRAARHMIELELKDQAIPQQIRVSWTHCHYGGARPWLHCPYCQRRRAILFRGQGGYFCRACLGNPPYASQAKSKGALPHWSATKLRLLLGGTAALDDEAPMRPKGMHRSTYGRHRQRLHDLECKISSRMRRRDPDYQNLIAYLPGEISK